MKLKLETAEMPEAKFKAFAQFLGWTETVMTEDLSPNVPVENPQTFAAFLEARYGGPIREDVASFRLSLAEARHRETLAAAAADLSAAREAERAAAAAIVEFSGE